MSFSIPTLRAYPIKIASAGGTASTLLLHFNGTDGQTTTIDSSLNNVPITLNSYVGTPGLSTTSPKFPTASWLNGTSNCGYISFPNSSLFDFGSNDWTIDFWYNCQSFPETNDAITMNHLHTNFTNGNGSVGGIVIRRNSLRSNALRLSISTNGSSYIIDTSSLHTNFDAFDGAGNANFQVWTHIAIERYGSYIYGYLDGIPNIISSTFSGSIYYNSSNPIGFGGAFSLPFSTANVTSAYYDEFRIVNGVALYKGNTFTPPNSPYTS